MFHSRRCAMCACFSDHSTCVIMYIVIVLYMFLTFDIQFLTACQVLDRSTHERICELLYDIKFHSITYFCLFNKTIPSCVASKTIMYHHITSARSLGLSHLLMECRNGQKCNQPNSTMILDSLTMILNHHTVICELKS